MREPVCTALLFADKIIIENNGKKGIIGTFSRIQSQAFPVNSAPWGIYIAVTNVEGKHSFSVNLENMETNEIIFPIEGDLDSKNSEEIIELVFNTNGVLFPREGKYSLNFTIDKEVLSSTVLYVEKVTTL